MSEPPGVFFSLCLCSESLQFTGTVRFGQVFVVKGNNSYSIRSTYFGARPKSESFFFAVAKSVVNNENSINVMYR